MHATTANRSKTIKLAAIAGVSLLSVAALAATIATSSDPGITVVDGSTTPAPAPAPTAAATSTATSPTDAYAAALAMWRAPRVKGACASCHGPDFFDLARIGTTDADALRRARIDGASDAEAADLIAGIKSVRARYALAPEDARSFRPLQPGGAVLPGASSIERDAALGDEMARFMPTLAGNTPIRSLADARRARDELLNVDFNRMRIGIALPLWSADIAHGPQEGTMNDWVTDVARVAKPGNEAQWLALQDAYLNDPSDLNFWKMYFSVDTMTQSFGPVTPYDPADAAQVERLTLAKFKTTLLGHHMLLTRAIGNRSFVRGNVAFDYLGTEEPFKSAFAGKRTNPANIGETVPKFLPNPWWELGEAARSALRPSSASDGLAGNTGRDDNARDALRLLGYPQFVTDSIDPQLSGIDLRNDMQLSWLMLGSLIDAGQTRISQSNSTRVGEYLQAAMWSQDLFVHRVLQTGVRMVSASYRPESSWAKAPPPYMLDFNYFAKYNRLTPTRWSSADSTAVDGTIKSRQLDAFKRITANFLRMSLYLHEEALDQGLIAPYGTSRPANYAEMNAFFDYAQLPGRAEDDALLRRVAAKSQTPLSF